MAGAIRGGKTRTRLDERDPVRLEEEDPGLVDRAHHRDLVAPVLLDEDRDLGVHDHAREARLDGLLEVVDRLAASADGADVGDEDVALGRDLELELGDGAGLLELEDVELDAVGRAAAVVLGGLDRAERDLKRLDRLRRELAPGLARRAARRGDESHEENRESSHLSRQWSTSP
jgi:hypothetical protein